MAACLIALGSLSPAAQAAGRAQEQDPALQKYQQAKRAGDAETALKELEQAASTGNAAAEAELANVYRGTVTDLAPLVQTDAQKAFALTADAVAKGNARAINDLALAYYTGDGVARDYGRALDYFLKSQAAGNRKAVRYLGLIYESGEGVAADPGKALEYYTQGAQDGDITSQCLLGSLYASGRGVPSADYAKAAEWYAQAAQRGDAIASGGMAAMGLLYETRQDGQRSAALARQWYAKAAAQGHELAQARLAALDGNAEGVPDTNADTGAESDDATPLPSARDMCISPSHH